VSAIVCMKCGVYMGVIMFMGHYTEQQMNGVKLCCPKCIQKHKDEDAKLREDIEKLR